MKFLIATILPICLFAMEPNATIWFDTQRGSFEMFMDFGGHIYVGEFPAHYDGCMCPQLDLPILESKQILSPQSH